MTSLINDKSSKLHVNKMFSVLTGKVDVKESKDPVSCLHSQTDMPAICKKYNKNEFAKRKYSFTKKILRRIHIF